MSNYQTLTKANMKLQKQRISSKLWTKGDQLAFAKMINSRKWSSKERNDAIYDLMVELENKLDDMERGYNITQEQSQIGIDYLQTTVLKKNGDLRNSKKAHDFEQYEADIIRNFERFEFMGFYENFQGYHSHYSPIYRTISKDGKYFDYTVAGQWGNPEVVGRGEVKTKLSKALK